MNRLDPRLSTLDGLAYDHDRSDWQLLHGDFGDRNVLMTATGVKVFDFDDCGYGPIEYDIRNSVYMVLFDSYLHPDPSRFEPLDRWLDDLPSAPIGIRTSSPEWHEVLRSFVATHDPDVR